MEGRGGPYLQRAAELSWIADFEDAVASDLSVFHRIDDPMSIGSARYLRLAEMLPAYQGAVRASLLPIVEAERAAELRAMSAQTDDPSAGYGSPATGAPVTDDIAALAALSQTPGFPGIEYQGG